MQLIVKKRVIYLTLRIRTVDNLILLLVNQIRIEKRMIHLTNITT